ncbi:MAG TPA: DUF1573 domain-containing protein [Saprospiraceae bacterium]|nr:DUF1573 domain-containing protein [Saprospiraceae bacterium]
MKNLILFSMMMVGLTLSSCAVLDVITEPGTETTPTPQTKTTPKGETAKTNKVILKPSEKPAGSNSREAKVITKPTSERPKSTSGKKSGKVIKKPTPKPTNSGSQSMSSKPVVKPTVAKAKPKVITKTRVRTAEAKQVPSTQASTKAVMKKPMKKAKTKAKVAKIALDEPRYNFGTIKEGTIIKRDFKFTNVGDTDLLIEIATGSCGCTVPEWPAKPIKPGETGVIHVTFDSTDKEYDTRVEVNIVANTEPIVTEIIMTGKVIPKRDFKKNSKVSKM